MDSSTWLWTIDATRGSVNFGRLMPFAGNTYELVFVGVALEEVYTAYVMDESGLKCLAKSEHNAGEYTIAFNTSELRGEFERNMHEVQTFHVIVRDSKRVVAEGDLSVQWQSLWEDTTTGEVFTMRGPKGNPGAPGRKGDPGLRGMSAYDIAVKNGFDGSEDEWLKTLKGVPGSLVRVQKVDENGEETGKWHNVFVKLDQNGRLRIVIGKAEHEPDASNDVYVSSQADMSVGGTKTFLESPIVPVITDANGEVDVTDDSGKAANTKWIRTWWTKIWEGILATTQKFSAQCTFLNGIVGNLKGNVVGDLEGTAARAIADKNGLKIDETYLPLTGGKMTGPLKSSAVEFIISGDDSSKAVSVSGGNRWGDGATIVLRGKNNSVKPGECAINVSDGEKTNMLKLLPDGTFTWGGKHVERVVASSFGSNSFYIKYASGLIIQGGTEPLTWTDGRTRLVTFPTPFSSTGYSVNTTVRYSANSPDEVYANGVANLKTTTSFKMAWSAVKSASNMEWLAIGM